jgi:hypothetical protein
VSRRLGESSLTSIKKTANKQLFQRSIITAPLEH